MSLEVLFIGVSGAWPKAGEETACFLINRKILVDLGWNCALNMLPYDVSPTDVDHVFCTHCHQDHVLGLPGLLLANRKRATVRSSAPPLQLYGPRDLGSVCIAAAAMLQADRLPNTLPEHEVHYVAPGDSVEIGDIKVTVGRAFHPIDARSYHFEDSASGARVVISGDTSYHAGLSAFAKGCDVLIHEAAAPGDASPEELQTLLHSRPQDAARVAMEAGTSSLALVHYDSSLSRETLDQAKKVFPNTRLAKKGQRLQVLGPGQAVWV
jgi:ribonuclease Z